MAIVRQGAKYLQFQWINYTHADILMYAEMSVRIKQALHVRTDPPSMKMECILAKGQINISKRAEIYLAKYDE